MNAQILYEDLFNFLKNNSNLTDVDIVIEAPNNSQTAKKAVICLQLIRDSLTRSFQCQSFSGIEVGVHFYAPDFKTISGRNNFEERTLQALKTFTKPGVNFQLNNRNLPLLVDVLQIYHSMQIYTFYFENS